MKDWVSNIVKMKDVETVTLTVECNSVVIKSMPKKLKDPGSINFPIKIYDIEEVHAL